MSPSHALLLSACLGLAVYLPPVSAQTASIADDLRMAHDAEPFRRTADAFVERAAAGDAQATLSMLSPALLQRSGEAGVRRALDAQILPFFHGARGTGRSVTVTHTTDAAGQRGFAFYMWLEQADAPARPFTVYVVEEDGRRVVANVVPDRRVEGRHR